ncbi:MAG: glutamate-5-semialdehyde dehydrogenase [Thermus sp.]|uniref:glutamate-5-semialdehyde dehydrogenase n=1 Tax=Thermus sp. TaxID=275 RepID=UPI0025E623FB|nr:glutamate-5-semialdehyde dehydrogenase [Thermus sp.]MCS6867677.1 glutamate-5-semialdehyde dehydrogenase [Thermus sp.]MCS7217491.1 glutamate-5-semialdehyde dehydrogenase [Thermus sp.]MDW8016729.1 glutamate-5-semialdehyde dehydrogenase [Thermus sp.]
MRALLQEMARKARAKLPLLAKGNRDGALLAMARLLEARWEEVREANRLDLLEAEGAGLSRAKLDRLALREKDLSALTEGLRQIAALPDPLGRIEGLTKRPNGLRVGRMRVPLGLIGFVYEARPGATVEAVAVALKAGNAMLLRGGKEAFRSNQALVALWHEALREAGLPEEAVGLVPTTDREAILEMCRLELLDLLIPRGGEELIRLVQQEARVPVLAHAKGVNHLYVDQKADLSMALRLALNGKTQRPAVCNALEAVLVHEKVAEAFLPRLEAAMREKGVELRACPRALPLLREAVPAQEDEWDREYLDLILRVKVVSGLEEALDHIARFGSRHTEAICTEDPQAAWRFLEEVDASLVLWNASTRFNDGFQLGLGAEIGISTSKLHAYGPMGPLELTTCKWVALGEGQERA